ncbi:MAG: tetratricopeptide repeat protein [Pseudomonadota bacterium]
MSDDSFIREVDEELRSDQFKGFWAKYKWFIIGAAVAIVLATGGYRAWDYYTLQAAGESGDRFIEAIERSNEGKHEEAIAILEQLGKDGVGEYPALANIRLAAELAKQGNIDDAIEAFDQIAGDSGFNETLRNVARLRAGLLLVDHGSYEEVTERLQTMANTGQPFRHSSREGLGLSAWKHNKLEDAHRWFTAISQDIEAPGGIRSRATIMLELLAGKGITGQT